MTENQFDRWPWLLAEAQVCAALGVSRNTLLKQVECGCFRRVKPRGCGQVRYQKRQVAQAAKIALEKLAPAGSTGWDRLPLLLDEKTVRNWTGYSPMTLDKIVKAGGLPAVKLLGGNARYPKRQVGEWLGF